MESRGGPDRANGAVESRVDPHLTPEILKRTKLRGRRLGRANHHLRKAPPTCQIHGVSERTPRSTDLLADLFTEQDKSLIIKPQPLHRHSLESRCDNSEIRMRRPP